MTYTQTVRLLLFGLLLSGSVSSYLFSLHLFVLLHRFASDVHEVMVTWQLIANYLMVGTAFLIVGLLVRKG